MQTSRTTADPTHSRWRTVLGFILAFLIPGQLFNFLGTLLGTSWWNGLVQPAFAPIGWWVFPLVWVVNYTVMGLAVAHVWPQRRREPIRLALVLFFAQLVLGFGWIPLVYGLQSILLGLVLDVTGLTLALVATALFARASRTAAWWMLPYLVWLVYTTALKLAMWQLN